MSDDRLYGERIQEALAVILEWRGAVVLSAAAADQIEAALENRGPHACARALAVLREARQT